MSRPQSSRPVKSKALSTPVPVITHTFLPSVTGDGEDMFCFRTLRFPEPSGFFQISTPLARSTQDKKSSAPFATLKKMRSCQTIGVDPEKSGMGSFQVMLSLVLHETGRFFS